jgi:hypothetical protein
MSLRELHIARENIMVAVTAGTRGDVNTFTGAHSAMKLVGTGRIFMTAGTPLTGNPETGNFLVRKRGFIGMTVQTLQAFMDGMGKVIFNLRLVFAFLMAFDAGSAVDLLVLFFCLLRNRERREQDDHETDEYKNERTRIQDRSHFHFHASLSRKKCVYFSGPFKKAGWNGYTPDVVKTLVVPSIILSLIYKNDRRYMLHIF